MLPIHPFVSIARAWKGAATRNGCRMKRRSWRMKRRKQFG